MRCQGNKKSNSNDFIERNAKFIFSFPAITLNVIMLALPLASILYLSFHTWFPSKPGGPIFCGLTNFKELFNDDRFILSILRTFYFTFGAVFIELVLGMIIALLFSRKFNFKGILRTLFLFPMVATPVAVALVWMLIFESEVGLLNYILSIFKISPCLFISDPKTVIPSLIIVDVWQWTPLMMLILLGGLTTINKELYEVASLEGASVFRIFWHITLPLLRPHIFLALLLRSVEAFKTFDIIFVMTQGGPGWSSETLNIFSYNQSFGYFHFGYASAAMVVYISIIAGFSLIFIKLRGQFNT